MSKLQSGLKAKWWAEIREIRKEHNCDVPTASKIWRERRGKAPRKRGRTRTHALSWTISDCVTPVEKQSDLTVDSIAALAERRCKELSDEINALHDRIAAANAEYDRWAALSSAARQLPAVEFNTEPVCDSPCLAGCAT